ncbi:hypothetical protein H8A95_03965 [Bradyrhizobium sp. Pear76]|nr:hypothetical protein [Bradyrhizobium oropedii]MCC8961495.1 hypothetical protein [Bradyrhizobium oropedii]
MQIGFFAGSFVLLVALIYATLNCHYRDRRKDKITDQMVRDRFSPDET